MASQALAHRDDTAAAMEKVVMNNDLKSLSPAERVAYVRSLTESLNMNPLTQPFQYIVLSGRLTLYATKNAAEQLRKINGVSIDRIEKEIVNDTYVVTVYGHDAQGRTDTDMGAVTITGLLGDNLVNAMLKAITKAKRRFTLSICGLGFLDESEVETIPGARAVRVDQDGVIHEPAPIRAIAQPEPKPALIEDRQMRKLWVLAKQYYGDKQGNAKLHDWIAQDYPEAKGADGAPSIRALTIEQASAAIAVLEESIAIEAAQPMSQEEFKMASEHAATTAEGRSGQ